MVFFRALGWSLLGGVAGFLIGAVAASIIAAATHMPSREGAPGYFALIIGFLAGTAGMLAAFLFVLTGCGIPLARIGFGLLGCLAAVIIAFLAWRWNFVQSQEYFTRKYSNVPLQLEILLPPGESIPSGGFAASLDDGSFDPERAEWSKEDHPQLEGRNLLSGQIRIWRVTPKRSLVLQLPGGRSRVLPVALSAFPVSKKSVEWSGWIVLDGGYRIRYRVNA